MNDEDRPFLTKEEMQEALGDIRKVPPEVVAWVNEKARELRATTGVTGLMDAFAEGRRLFPDCGWTWGLLYMAFIGNRDLLMPPPPEDAAS
jgi:hypothetical protein